MSKRLEVSLEEIRDWFAFELAEVGGELGQTTAAKGGGALYAYGALPQVLDTIPGDPHGAGVAMKATRELVLIHPYIVRHICVNGTVMAQVSDTEQLLLGDYTEPQAVRLAMGDAVRWCSSPTAFETGIERIRTAHRHAPPFGQLSMEVTALLTIANRGLFGEVMRRILDRFSAGSDRSAFGLMDAVTTTARDERDPELAWQLENLAGRLVSPEVLRSLPEAELEPGSKQSQDKLVAA